MLITASMLEEAIRQRNLATLQQYMDTTDADDNAVILSLDADARLTYYQLKFSTGQRPSELLQRAPPFQFQIYSSSHNKGTVAGSFQVHMTPSLRESSMHEHLLPGAATDRRSTASPPVVFEARGVQTETDTPPLLAASSRPTELPLMLHRKLNRKLFRSYASYLPDALQTTAASPSPATAQSKLTWSSDADQSRAIQTYRSSWEAAAAPLGEVVVPMPTADTSTFLIHRVAQLTVSSSPKTITLHRKNVELHEHESRTDVEQLEAYEWMLLEDGALENLMDCLSWEQLRQRSTVESEEARDRLRISTNQVSIWQSFLEAVDEWRFGPAKEQNMLLVNEIVLRQRLTNDEIASRRNIATVQRHEAEHQLAEWRRLSALEKEHQRAALLHRHLLVALSMQGVDVTHSPSSSSLTTPATSAEIHRRQRSPISTIADRNDHRNDLAASLLRTLSPPRRFDTTRNVTLRRHSPPSMRSIVTPAHVSASDPACQVQ